ncbi:translation initiation factor IF-2-like [Oenanthe melanoleuca]|uniref:translation initiation factor IF-2-like n=1 Tax=Oenanthe melanoleuca TaxID=2939378 RepID=UPI0024C1848D|nr:translation initiation factor IF-2-like [Oenanthe melanoleuca]
MHGIYWTMPEKHPCPRCCRARRGYGRLVRPARLTAFPGGSRLFPAVYLAAPAGGRSDITAAPPPSVPACLLPSFPACLLPSVPACLLPSFPACLLPSVPACLLPSVPAAAEPRPPRSRHRRAPGTGQWAGHRAPSRTSVTEHRAPGRTPRTGHRSPGTGPRAGSPGSPPALPLGPVPTHPPGCPAAAPRRPGTSTMLPPLAARTLPGPLPGHGLATAATQKGGETMSLETLAGRG